MQRVTIDPIQIQQNVIQLNESQIHYLRRVLRLGEGDRFISLNGQGQGWVAVLSKERAYADILEPWQCHTELSIPIQLIMAMPKTGMDEIVRQSTELGLSALWPVLSDRTILKPSPKKVDRWRRIAQESMEQCERQWVPTIAEPMRVGDALRSANKNEADSQTCKWICVARSDENMDAPPHLLAAMLELMATTSTPKKMDSMLQESHKTITVAVGPEGGWTPSEVQAAIALGYQPISLGPRVLRAVTAPLGAIAIMAAVLECT
ncbi:MAG: 16S rRNA (uracil(1498)-N(3))-methyltransferase [Cyanobacteria bacterium P01_F01_bin.150]